MIVLYENKNGLISYCFFEKTYLHYLARIKILRGRFGDYKMTNNPLVSIIIPYYNVEENLVKKSINSAVSQTYENTEILIINDGSRMENTAMIERLAKRDNRITIINKENEGVSVARNTGVQHCNGDYVVFLDSDDALRNNFIEEALSIAKEYDSDFVIGGVQLVNDDRMETPNVEKSIMMYSPKELRKHLISNVDLIRFDRYYIGRGPWARLAERKLVLSVSFDKELSIGEDLVWNLAMIETARKVVVCKDCWYYYYYNQQSAIHRYNEKLYVPLVNELNAIRAHIDENDCEEITVYRDHIVEEVRRIANNYLCHPHSLKNRTERRKTIKKMYGMPWNEINDRSYFSKTNTKNKRLLTLYKYHLLFNLKLLVNCAKR